MEDISLHILDIALNSIDAGATWIFIQIDEDHRNNSLRVTITDNGRGMTKEEMERLLDPFFTTKGKKTGLGVSLLAQSAREADGQIEVESTPGRGTRVVATFVLNHIDRKPLGDIVSTLGALIAGAPHLDIDFVYRIDDRQYRFSTRPIRDELDDVPLNHPEIWYLIREEISEGIKSLRKGGKDG